MGRTVDEITFNEAFKNEGLKQKYIIQKVSGKEVNPNAKYFVLRYDSEQSDKEFERASKTALAVFAECIEDSIPELANDLREAIKPSDNE